MTRCPKYKHRVKHRLGEYKNMLEECSAQPPSNQASTSGLGDAGSVAQKCSLLLQAVGAKTVFSLVTIGEHDAVNSAT